MQHGSVVRHIVLKIRGSCDAGTEVDDDSLASHMM